MILSFTAARTATSLGTAALVLYSASFANAETTDRHVLPAQTQIVGGFWDGVRPLLDVRNPEDQTEFYQEPDGVDVNALAPGTVLRERTFNYHVATVETPLHVSQILYVTTNALGEHEANVTSVIHPPQGAKGSVVAYQSFYDSSNPADNPSRMIAGNMSLGGLIPAFETSLLMPALLAGHSVVLADTQGKNAEFAVGPAYGAATLDSLRAATAAQTTPITQDSRIGLFGYSGGSIASNWAAIRARKYAPDIDQRLVGVAQGGMFVNPVNNLEYASEGLLWSGVAGLAVSSITDSYQVNIDRYLNDYGRTVMKDTKDLSIVESIGRYPSLRWRDIAKPEYPNPYDVPELKKVIEKLNMGSWDSPSTPMFVFQGAAGHLEGTPPHPSLGAGDSIMVTRDVRSLVKQYCQAGTPVEYREYSQLSHTLTTIPWATEGFLWLDAQLRGAPDTNNCASIPQGNAL